MDWATLFKSIYDFLLGALTKQKVAGEKAISVKIPLGSGYDRDADERRKRAVICDFAQRQVGEPYKFGVEPPLGEDWDLWDCSELYEHAYHEAGLKLPDGSQFQFDFCRPVKNPKPGDLGFLWNDKWGRIGHVACYVGNDMIVDAVGGEVGRVRIAHRSLIEDSPRFRGWRRHPDFAWPIEERV